MTHATQIQVGHKHYVMGLGHADSSQLPSIGYASNLRCVFQHAKITCLAHLWHIGTIFKTAIEYCADVLFLALAWTTCSRFKILKSAYEKSGCLHIKAMLWKCEDCIGKE